MAGILREQVIKRFARSPKWGKVRKEWLVENPACICCGKSPKLLRTFRLQVHHIVPFHIAPWKELDTDNLATLCSNPRCHLDKGHLGNWRSWNWNVLEDCANWLWKYQTRPYKEKK